MRPTPPRLRMVLKGLQREVPWYARCVFVTTVITVLLTMAAGYKVDLEDLDWGLLPAGFFMYMLLGVVRAVVSELPPRLRPKAAELRYGFFAVTLSLFLGGCLMLAANGISIAMEEERRGWHIFPVPCYPVARMVVYVTVALTLQFVSGWLLMPVGIPESTENATWLRFWISYVARLILCVAGSVVVASVVAFLVMALGDA